MFITTLLVEYGVPRLLAGTLGSSAAIALTWAVSEHALKLNWHFIPSVNLLGVAVATALVMAVGGQRVLRESVKLRDARLLGWVVAEAMIAAVFD